MRLVICTLLTLVFFNCSGTKNRYKIEKEGTLNFKQAYYQSWIAGVRGGGSGLNIYLELIPYKGIELKGAFFQEKYCDLKPQGNNKYQGYIKGESNLELEETFQGSKEKKKEEKTIEVEKEFPFELKFDEAVVSFLLDGKMKYVKIKLLKKEMEAMPQ